MLHIRQINSVDEPDKAYTVVITTSWQGPLSTYPCLIELPSRFELVDGDIPENAQYLNYRDLEDT